MSSRSCNYTVYCCKLHALASANAVKASSWPYGCTLSPFQEYSVSAELCQSKREELQMFILHLMMFSYSLSLPLLSFHLRYITDASTLAGLDVFGSFNKLTCCDGIRIKIHFPPTCLPLKGVLCGRSGWGSTFHKAAPRTGGRPPVGEGWIHTGRRSKMSTF